MATCPECGIDLTGIDPIKHSLVHWPERLPRDPQYALARLRQSRLIGAALSDEDMGLVRRQAAAGLVEPEELSRLGLTGRGAAAVAAEKRG